MKKGVILGCEQKENVVEGLSIIIPANNEEAGIASVIEGILSVMDRSNIDYELLVLMTDPLIGQQR